MSCRNDQVLIKNTTASKSNLKNQNKLYSITERGGAAAFETESYCLNVVAVLNGM